MRAAALPLLLAGAAQAAALDLTRAVIVHSGASKQEQKAVAMLVEEVEKRSGVRWQPNAPLGARATITIERGSGGPAEGYSLRTSATGVVVTGNDARGVLFGVGRLLRELHMQKGSVTVADNLSAATAPKYRLRGHQLGYRPKTNSYDAWSVPMWEQYIRDLAVFGTNAVELIPPRSDDDASSPHFPLPPMDMMIEMSRLLDDYGLDVWIWYPAMDQDYSDPKIVEFALNEWGEVFKKLPRIDAIFVPGGDPGHTRPKFLMALLEKQTQNLHRYHPKAQMWVSPQGFSREWMDEFLSILQNEQPAWLGGVVFGPQVRLSLPELRAAVPAKYPIRHYPDITHSRQCQYPVPDWDWAYAATEAREGINPRPMDQARIFRLLQPYTAGFLTYSEGCNDDVNKIVWSALGWDPDADVKEVLRQYARYFIGEQYTDSFADGLLALEQNWRGPLASNESVPRTLQQFRAMEKSATVDYLRNWRFEQGLYRAYYDSYVAGRLRFERGLEQEAMTALESAGKIGAMQAMEQAEKILERAGATLIPGRDRLFQLAEALYQTIRMQLSVDRYRAISVGRGANLDTIDMPLNNRPWLKHRFAEIRKLSDERERLKAIDEIVHWTDAGTGGFYDDLGDLTNQPHLVRGPGFDQDPAFLHSTLMSYTNLANGRASWWSYAESLNNAPLTMRYTGLDRGAGYKVRVVYGGDSPRVRVRLEANGGIEVHPLMLKPAPVRPLEFDVPPKATAAGDLTLSWYRDPEAGGNGRGAQVSEVWLIKK